MVCSKSYPDADAMDEDEEVERPVIDVGDEEFQMTLPSGAKVGHRYLINTSFTLAG